jgi:hypothetical protein
LRTEAQARTEASASASARVLAAHNPPPMDQIAATRRIGPRRLPLTDFLLGLSQSLTDAANEMLVALVRSGETGLQERKVWNVTESFLV